MKVIAKSLGLSLLPSYIAGVWSVFVNSESLHVSEVSVRNFAIAMAIEPGQIESVLVHLVVGTGNNALIEVSDPLRLSVDLLIST